MAVIIQPSVIDVAHWHPDELFANYPEGARSKNAFFAPDPLPFDFLKGSRRYMFKKSNKRYPDQFWAEVVAYQIGTLLGVSVPPAFAAMNSDTEDCAALIEWFYIDGESAFVSGGNYMQLIDNRYDRKKGDAHNFRWIHTIMRATKKLSPQNQEKVWAEALLFDGLIGNTDRHQENWGYLWSKKEQDGATALVAPFFDNGTSLGHERFPARLEAWNEVNYLEYVSKGTHQMKWTEKESRCGHFEMMSRICSMFPSLKEGLQEMIVNFSVDIIANNLTLLRKIELPVPLTEERAELYLRLLSLRKKKLEEVLS